MPPTYTHTRLLVTKFAECFRFYRDVMGLEPAFGGENEVYAEFKTGACTIALFARELMATAIDQAGLPASAKVQDPVMLTFGVDNVDAAYEELKKKGAKFLTKPHDQPEWFIRVAHFRDPEGNLLEINAPSIK